MACHIFRPARAASMVALRARRLVRSAMASPTLAFQISPRRGDVDTLGRIFVDLISHRADRNAQEIGGPCAIAQTVL